MPVAGLALRFSDARNVAGIIRNLTSIGVLVTWEIMGAAAHYLADAKEHSPNGELHLGGPLLAVKQTLDFKMYPAPFLVIPPFIS